MYILLPPTITPPKAFVIVRATCSRPKHSRTRILKTGFEKISYWSFSGRGKRSFNQDSNKQMQGCCFSSQKVQIRSSFIGIQQQLCQWNLVLGTPPYYS